MRLGTVACLAPGVMGQTGIETEEIVEAVVKKIKPDVVLAVDALAAGSPERLNATIQLCDTGVSPGAGMGNRRQELSEATLGIPVLAVGVPTVIDAGILTAGGEKQYKNMYVTTKDMDAVAERLSRLLAGAVNRWLHHLNEEELQAYLYSILFSLIRVCLNQPKPVKQRINIGYSTDISQCLWALHIGLFTFRKAFLHLQHILERHPD